jgi:hypothetical protein
MAKLHLPWSYHRYREYLFVTRGCRDQRHGEHVSVRAHCMCVLLLILQVIFRRGKPTV